MTAITELLKLSVTTDQYSESSLPEGSRILLLDASNHWILAGIAEKSSSGDFEITSIRTAADRDSFKKLLPILRSVMNESGGKKPDHIVCINGPGSFTGIRVTVSTARNLAQLWDIPVFAVNSLLFYGYSIFRSAGIHGGFSVSLDGKQSKFYNCFFPDSTGVSDYTFLSGFTGAFDSTSDEIMKQLPDGASLFTDSPDAFAHYSAFVYPNTLHRLQEPDAADLTLLALHLNFNKKTTSWNLLLPDYMRPDPATLKFPDGIIK
jgi:tRNA threonylcarbamoyladenosine biosynthesis protein TsaB